MRVDPLYVKSLVSALDQSQAREQQLSSELSSGVRVTSLSVDPVAAGENVLLLNQIQRDDSFTETSSLVHGQLQVADSVLGQVVDQLTTAIGLATSANNGTLNASNLKSISNQLAGIVAEITSLANTNYQGQYIFSGGQNSTQPFVADDSSSPAVTTYYGDSNVNYLTTPTGQSIQLNVPGDQIFTSVFTALNNLVADYANGESTSTSVLDTAALSSALNDVSQQRVIIDNSITRLTGADQAVSNEKLQITSAQTDLIQADFAQAATDLSLTETQQAALEAVISKLGSGSLFDKL
jgi:flagellar hook-associated protein 3 FlgL